VLEAWDEANLNNPNGLHGNDSLHKAGRAAVVTLANDLDLEDDLDSTTLTRLGQLAVCAGMDVVEEVEGEERLRVGVAEDGWEEGVDEQREESKRMFWNSMENMGKYSLIFFSSLSCYW
jgi:hypothetical protein